MSGLPDYLKQDPNLTNLRVFPSEEARTVPMPDDLPPELTEMLAAGGIERLYTHQGACHRIARSGRSFVVVTPTASGKTLCYNLPVLSSLLEDPQARALMLFPTKALTHDQERELLAVSERLPRSPLGVASFDGDTPGSARRAIRDRARIVLSNPDMLHKAILPQHASWLTFLQGLRYVVLDELHVYRGVFGSHVANVLRRLRRICDFYGARPRFLCASATIANPGELAETLTGDEVEEVTESGAPRPERCFFFYNPPVVNRELGIRASAVETTTRIIREGLDPSAQTIVFAPSRLRVEVLTRKLREAAEEMGLSPEAVHGYRGGYLPRLRRQIEEQIKDGTIKIVVSTNALELGIDIGGLDCSILSGYPGSIAGTWQQAGRAGRRGRASVSVLVARSAPLDQFIIRHPDFFFGRSPERARINPDNLLILVSHIKCAAFELPFSDGEGFGSFGPEDTREVLEFLQEHRILNRSGDKWFWMQDYYPADSVSLRSMSDENVLVVEQGAAGKGEVVAEVDFHDAPTTLFEGAIYMLGPRTYAVAQLDLEGKRAFVEPVQADYYTEAVSHRKVSVTHGDKAEGGPGVTFAQGDVAVVETVAGYKKLKLETNENVGYGDISLPDLELHTSSFWFSVDRERLLATGFDKVELFDGFKGLGHALRTVAAFQVMAETADLGWCVGEDTGEEGEAPGKQGRVTAQSFLDRYDPTLFVYERRPGGVGFSDAIFRGREELFERTRELVGDCACERGCPVCVGPRVADAMNSTREVVLALLGILGGTNQL